MTPYYEDGLVTIYHGDALEVMGSVAADVLITDPPYGMGYDSGWSGATIANDHDTSTRDAVLRQWCGPALVFGRWSEPRPVGTRHVLTWDKGDWPGMGDLALPWGPSTEEVYVIGTGFIGPRRGSILRDPHRPVGVTALHPSQKPPAVMARLIEATTGIVLDPFAGSGTTGRVANRLGRRAVLIDLSADYLDQTMRRNAQSPLGLTS